MRNLKRALSLTLASVMLLGMMVVGSSAAAGYDDVKETDNVEAIEVLQAVEVMVGDDRGFGPDRPVTRNEMAVVMGKLLNLDYNYYSSTCPFTDVADWARGWVGACAANGIVSGRGNGIYDGESSVTAIEAASMMMRALGYFKNIEDYADGFATVTVRQGSQIGIFKGVGTDANTPMTRNQVAQMALNALQSDMVTFTGTPGIDVNGVKVGYRAEYTPRTSTDPKYNRLIDNKHSSNIDYSGQYYVQLGEELYDGDLVKRVDSDIFERPSYTWTYKTEKIGTYVDQDKLLASYTTGVDGRTLYDLLNNITIRDYDLDVYVDGHEAGKGTGYATKTNNTLTVGTQYDYVATDEEITTSNLVRSNTNDVGITGDGVLTEVYLDRDNEVITIASIHTWLAQATSSYNSTRETSTLKVYLINADGTTKTVNVIDVPAAENVTADSFYLVQMSDKDTSLLEIAKIDEPQILAESKVTKFTTTDKTNRTYPTKLTVEGTEYNDSDRAYYDTEVLDLYDNDLLANNSYNVYLDKYGYFIGVDLAEGEKQYVFITGYDMKNSNLSVKTAEAAGIFLDGTMENITVNVKDTNENIKTMVNDKATGGNLTAQEKANSQAYYKQWGTGVSDGVYLLNRWYTYTKTDAGVYTLKPCVNKDGEAMMLASKTDDVTTGDPSEMKMNASKLRLDSVTDSGADRDGDLLTGENMQYTNGTGTGAGQVLSSVRAYGEDESVFITVDVDDVSASAGGETKLNVTKAITDVNGVYTGVQDVDIITKTTNRIVGRYYINNEKNPDGSADSGTIGSTPATSTNDAWHTTNDQNGHFVQQSGDYSYLGENAYAVYDKDHFIIGAVILGEAEGNNATKAYILDPVKYERYENGTYYWQFEAVINGEIVTQEAETEYTSVIDRMRNNQYEVVELRYNSNGVVTDVKQIERTDTGADEAHSGKDKIYGYPFAEILTYNSTSNKAGHKVNDDESIYDVVLTGNSDAATVDFTYVTRPRVADNVEHGPDANEFATTQLGTLKLQGRTLYVDAGQHDYGIDFIRDAKAVVKQREGTPNNNDWETRAYGSVQEAIDSLGDAVPATKAKEYRGIITAVLNSSGVAEWVVFYSDTVAETRTDTGVGVSTMDVQINFRVGAQGEAQKYMTAYKAEKPDNGNVVYIPNPDTLNGGNKIIKGYHPLETTIPIIWEHKAEGKEVTFTYVPDNGSDQTGGNTFAVRVGYSLTANWNTGNPAAANVMKYEEVSVPVSASGYGKLTADLLKGVPTGYTIDTVTSNTDLGEEIDSNSNSQARTLYVSVNEKTPTSIELLNVPANFYVNHGANAAKIASDAKAAGITVKVNYDATTSRTIAADDAQVAWSGTTTADGNVTATYTAADAGTTTKTATAAFKRYASLAATGLVGQNSIAAYDKSCNLTLPAKVKVGDTVTVTYTATAEGVTTLPTTTRTVTVAGATTTPGSVTPSVTDGTANTKATVTVTFEVATITAGTITITTDVNA